jgi:hypothetical protein
MKPGGLLFAIILNPPPKPQFASQIISGIFPPPPIRGALGKIVFPLILELRELLGVCQLDKMVCFVAM